MTHPAVFQLLIYVSSPDANSKKMCSVWGENWGGKQDLPPLWCKAAPEREAAKKKKKNYSRMERAAEKKLQLQ